MTEQKTEIVGTGDSAGQGLIGMAAVATGKIFRFSLNVLSLPLLMLPGNSRRHAQKAMGEFAMAILVLPKEFAATSERVVDRLMGEDSSKIAWPRAEEITERARSFASRMMRSAEDFSAGVVSASQKVGDAAEQTASKVDEWVQKKS